MMGGFLLFKIILLIFVLTNKNIEGCECFPEHPQAEICSSDFAFKGKVLEEIPDQISYLYKVKLITSIKGIKEDRYSILTIETPTNAGACGIRLSVGKTYVLSGRFDGDAKGVTACDLFRNVEDLTKKEKKFFFCRGPNSYVRNCDCQDIVGSDAGSFPSPGCVYPVEKEMCYYRTALCKKTDYSCKWKYANC